MRFSKYSIIQKIDQEYIIFNSMYSSIVSVSCEELDYIKKSLNHNKSNNLIKELLKLHIVVEDDQDELHDLINKSNKLRYSPEQVTFTIAPSMDCNFKCHYCYEDGFRNSTMSKEIAKQTADFILNNVEKHQNLKIIWYGGEPLMNFRAIQIISEIIIENPDKYKTFFAEIVTNGYFLNKNTSLKLSEFHVNYAQVTLDGDKEMHDSRRYLLSGKGSFDRILKNILDSVKIIPISIRINIDHINSSENVLLLMEQLQKNNIIDEVEFFLAPVEDLNNSANPNCLTPKEFSREELAIYKELKNRNINIVPLPRIGLGFCEAINEQDYVVDPIGHLYKCWAQIGNPFGRVGDIYEGIIINEIHNKFTYYAMMEDIKCDDCSVQPLCLGGCPLIKINDGKSKCISEKYIIKDKIKYALK